MRTPAAVADRIVGILGAYVGPHMALAALQGHAAKLKLDLNHLTRADLDRLAERIALGLRVFVGPAKADDAGRAVREIGADLQNPAPSGSAGLAAR